jgi:hypothetical protein
MPYSFAFWSLTGGRLFVVRVEVTKVYGVACCNGKPPEDAVGCLFDARGLGSFEK